MTTRFINRRSHTVCTWCHSNIPVGAKVCRTCHRHQRRVYERLKFLLTVSGIIAVLISAIAFVYPRAEQFVRSFLQPQIKVNYFATDTHNSIVENIGPSDVFLRYVMIEPITSELRTYRKFHAVNKRLKHGEVISLDLTSGSTGRKIHSSASSDFRDLPAVPENFLRNLKRRWNENDPDVTIRVYGPDHAMLSAAQEMISDKYGAVGENTSYPNLYNISHKCVLHYSHRYSETHGPHEFECVGIFATTN